jgi:hypothetical protein
MEGWTAKPAGVVPRIDTGVGPYKRTLYIGNLRGA